MTQEVKLSPITLKCLCTHYKEVILQSQKAKQALKDQIELINQTLVNAQNEYSRLKKLNR